MPRAKNIQAAAQGDTQSDMASRNALLQDQRLSSMSPGFPIEAMEDVISLQDIWRVLARYKWLIMLAPLVGALLAFASYIFSVPFYRADVQAVAVPELDTKSSFPSQLGGLGGLAALAGIDMDRGSKEQEAVATLGSRYLTMKFIEDEGLIQELFYRDWDEAAQEWDVNDPEDIPTLWDAWEYFDEKIRRINNDKKTGLVTLSVEWRDPQLAAEWANELVRRANELLRLRATEDSRKAIEYLQEQLTRTSVVELHQVVNHLIEAEMKKVILANINKEYAFKVVDPAIVAEEPFKPKLVVRVVFGIAFGLMLGIFLALLLNLLRPASPRNLQQPGAVESIPD